MRFLSLPLLLSIALSGCVLFRAPDPARVPTTDDGTWYFIPLRDIPKTRYHTRHCAIFGRHVDGYNAYVLKGIDRAQAHALDGGGYFIGKDERPTESPIGYPVRLFGKRLLNPPRPTSYCSGSTYTALIEALDMIYPLGRLRISSDRLEAMRMQEPDGGRREDLIKYWGNWNADGNGSEFALVQYSGMGEEIPPERARPGDFMNIAWTNGGGHSVVFLGWFVDTQNRLGVIWWSSAAGTNGMSDVVACPLDRIQSIKVVRLTHPERVFHFDVAQPVDIHVPGDTFPH
jgi:hypothetical protein